MKHEAVMFKATSGVAVAGVTTPLWPPSLEQVSGMAGHLVPILSAVFLGVQLVRFLWQWWRDARA